MPMSCSIIFPHYLYRFICSSQFKYSSFLDKCQVILQKLILMIEILVCYLIIIFTEFYLAPSINLFIIPLNDWKCYLKNRDLHFSFSLSAFVTLLLFGLYKIIFQLNQHKFSNEILVKTFSQKYMEVSKQNERATI